MRREDECKHQVPEGVQQGFAQGAQGDFLTLHAIDGDDVVLAVRVPRDGLVENRRQQEEHGRTLDLRELAGPGQVHDVALAHGHELALHQAVEQLQVQQMRDGHDHLTAATAIGKQHDTNGIGGFGIHPRGLLCVHGAPDGCGGGGGARGLRAAVREVFEVAAL